MAGFKTQIIARFKVKFPNVTLSKKRLDAIADKLDAKTDDEDSIDANLDAMNEFFPFADIQKADDKIRDLESRVKPVDKPAPDDKPEDKPAPDDMPVWAKGLVTGLEALTSKITAIEGEKTTSTRRQQLEAKLKDAPEAFKKKVLKDFDRMRFDKEEDFNEYLTDTEADLGDVVQEESNNGLGRDKPLNSKGKPAGDKEVSAAMQELIAERTAKAESKNTKTTV